MKNTTYLFIVCAFLFLTNTYYAQGEYLNKGESGFGFIFSLDKNNVISGNSLEAGFSLNGIFDFDLSFSFGNAKSSNPNGYNETGTVNYSAVQPAISAYIFKPDSSHKSGICFTLAYETTTYTYDSGNYYFRGDKTSSATLLALTVYGGKKNKKINFLPSFTAGCLFTDGVANLLIGSGLGIKYDVNDKLGLLVSPSISFYPLSTPSEYKAKYSFSLTFGLLFSAKE